ncbi:hypothetical protein POM88_037727 [Heracleum sosnowskyi]|uniref:Secreted protein n=1 Tax=Heracleum sosnowskyi TaxID=360622 RepID=A0AAD8HT67_9APIA|nr:hypothetical protein POM88_037727 [Heracleum sosnowskyi]
MKYSNAVTLALQLFVLIKVGTGISQAYQEVRYFLTPIDSLEPMSILCHLKHFIMVPMLQNQHALRLLGHVVGRLGHQFATPYSQRVELEEWEFSRKDMHPCSNHTATTMPLGAASNQMSSSLESKLCSSSASESDDRRSKGDYIGTNMV